MTCPSFTPPPASLPWPGRLYPVAPMIIVVADSEADAVRVVNGLIAGAEHEETCGSGDRLAARRYRRLADSIADQLAVLRPERKERL